MKKKGVYKLAKSLFERKIEEVCKEFEIESSLVYKLIELQIEHEGLSQKNKMKKYNLVKEIIEKEYLK